MAAGIRACTLMLPLMWGLVSSTCVAATTRRNARLRALEIEPWSAGGTEH